MPSLWWSPYPTTGWLRSYRHPRWGSKQPKRCLLNRVFEAKMTWAQTTCSASTAFIYNGLLLTTQLSFAFESKRYVLLCLCKLCDFSRHEMCLVNSVLVRFGSLCVRITIGNTPHSGGQSRMCLVGLIRECRRFSPELVYRERRKSSWPKSGRNRPFLCPFSSLFFVVTMMLAATTLVCTFYF